MFDAEVAPVQHGDTEGQRLAGSRLGLVDLYQGGFGGRGGGLSNRLMSLVDLYQGGFGGGGVK